MAINSAQNSMATIEQFLSRVGHVKAAEEAHTEAGSIGGQTEHPVKNVDDRTEVAQTGARSKENEKDVKEEQGAISVDSTAEAKAKTASAVLGRFAKQAENPFMKKVEQDLKADASSSGSSSSSTDESDEKKGRDKKARLKKAEGAVQTPGSAADDAEESPLNPQPTGQTPDIETKGVKAGKKDPGSTHPAKTDNTSLDGHKYAADTPLHKIAADMQALGNAICGQISHMSDQLGNTKTAADARQQMGNGPRKQAEDADANLQMQAGWELAGLATNNFDKRAADAMVHEALTGVIKTANDDAVKVAYYLDNFFAAARTAEKQAEGDPTGGAGGGMPPIDPSAMAGGGAPGGDGMAGGGGPPPGAGGGGDAGGMMAALGGGADAGGGGGDIGAPPGGGGGGAGGGEAQHLADLLDQLGVTPEELEQAMSQEGGGGGGGADAGGAPPGGGGAPPGGDAMGGGEPKMGGDRRAKQAAAKQGNHHEGMKDYITEIIQRSRRRG